MTPPDRMRFVGRTWFCRNVSSLGRPQGQAYKSIRIQNGLPFRERQANSASLWPPPALP